MVCFGKTLIHFMENNYKREKVPQYARRYSENIFFMEFCFLCFSSFGDCMDFMMFLLVSLGAIIGFIIGIALLFPIVGFINVTLGVHLWNIEAKTGFWNMFFHGLVLFILLLIVKLMTSTLPNYAFPGKATLVVTFIIRTFPNGFIGKKVSSWFGWETSGGDEED
jgi:hypothetical protein